MRTSSNLLQVVVFGSCRVWWSGQDILRDPALCKRGGGLTEPTEPPPFFVTCSAALCKLVLVDCIALGVEGAQAYLAAGERPPPTTATLLGPGGWVGRQTLSQTSCPRHSRRLVNCYLLSLSSVSASLLLFVFCWSWSAGQGMGCAPSQTSGHLRGQKTKLYFVRIKNEPAFTEYRKIRYPGAVTVVS